MCTLYVSVRYEEDSRLASVRRIFSESLRTLWIVEPRFQYFISSFTSVQKTRSPLLFLHFDALQCSFENWFISVFFWLSQRTIRYSNEREITEEHQQTEEVLGSLLMLINLMFAISVNKCFIVCSKISQKRLISHHHSPWKSLQSIVFKLFVLWNQKHSIHCHMSEREILPNEKLVARFGNDC